MTRSSRQQSPRTSAPTDGSRAISPALALTTGLALATLAALPSLLAGCSAKLSPQAQKYAANLTAKVQNVCPQAVHTDVGVAAGDPRLTAFGAILGQELAAAGLTVQAPEKVEAIRAATAKEVGALYDPLTGRRDEARYGRFRAELARRYREQLGCDTVVEPDIALVQAAFIEGSSQWDGSEDVVSGARNLEGSAAALSLWLTFRGPDGEVLYFSTGGIELLVHMEKTGLLQWQPKELPQAQWLTNVAKNRSAIRAALLLARQARRHEFP